MEYFIIMGKVAPIIAKVTVVGMGGLLAFKLQKDRVKLATAQKGKKLNSGKDGLKVSKNFQLSQRTCMAHVAIFASTQSGKTTSIIIPNLLENSIRGSIVVYDPAGEIYKLTHKYQESIGRKVIVYNPLVPGKTEYNLLKECKDDTEVAQLSQALLTNGSLSIELSTGKKAGGTEWLQLSQNLLTACLLYAKSMNLSVKHALKLTIDHTEDEIEHVLSGRALEYWMAFKQGADALGMQSSIKGTLQSNLSLFYEDLAINYSSFNAKLLREKECILYIQYPERKAYYLAPLMAPVYSQLIDQLLDLEGNFIWFILDEFANIGMLTNFNLTISTAAKRNINFTLVLQDFNQLKSVYGYDNAETIWSNTKTKVAFPGLSNVETLQKLSTLSGEEEIKIRQENREVKTKKMLYAPDEIRRIERGKCMILSDNFNAILDETNFWENNPEYVKNSKL